MHKLLLLLCVLAVATTVQGSTDGPDLSHGFHILSKVVRQYLNSQPEDLKLGEGVHIVSTRSVNDARAVADDGSILGAMDNYLQGHELRIKLQELMPGDNFGRSFKDAMMAGFDGNETGSPRGKGGGGGGGGGGKGGGMGGILLMGLMMGKMMAALGIGGVGLLAMKALMVSALALMLATIIGLKKLVSHDHEEGHTVIHASPHGHEHHRKKREAADIAYHAWDEYKLS